MKLMPSDELKIVSLYRQNLTYCQIVEAIGRKVTSHNSIAKVLRKHGAMRPFRCKATNPAKHNCLDDLTPAACYWIGLLMADGYVDDKKGCISLDLHQDDLAVVHGFADFFGGSTPMPHRRMYRSSVYSRQL